MTRHPHTTLRMIAEKVGVAVGTVSAILSGHKGTMRYSSEAEARVRATAKALHYEPNLQARGMLCGKSYLLGVVFNSQFWYIVERIIPAIRSECYDNDYELLLYPSDTMEMERRNLEQANRRQVDGILLLPVSSPGKENLQAFLDIASSGRPVIQFLYQITDKLPFVGRNISTLCKNGIEHLLQNGFKRPGLIVSSNYNDIEEGGASYTLAQSYAQEMSARGLSPMILPLPLSSSGVTPFQNGLRCAPLLPTEQLMEEGWLVASSAMAYGLLHGMSLKGIVSKDMHPFFVSCSDDLDLPPELLPPMPYFPVPYNKVGKLTAQWGLNGAPAENSVEFISSNIVLPHNFTPKHRGENQHEKKM